MFVKLDALVSMAVYSGISDQLLAVRPYPVRGKGAEFPPPTCSVLNHKIIIETSSQDPWRDPFLI